MRLSKMTGKIRKLQGIVINIERACAPRLSVYIHEYNYAAP